MQCTWFDEDHNNTNSVNFPKYDMIKLLTTQDSTNKSLKLNDWSSLINWENIAICVGYCYKSHQKRNGQANASIENQWDVKISQLFLTKGDQPNKRTDMLP